MEKKYEIDIELYSQELIESAIATYREYWIDISFTGSDLVIKSDEDDIEETFNEFMNYIISLEC